MRPQGLDIRNGVVAIANSRGYELVMFDLNSNTVLGSLPYGRTEGIYPGGVSFISDTQIVAGDIDKNLVYLISRV